MKILLLLAAIALMTTNVYGQWGVERPRERVAGGRAERSVQRMESAAYEKNRRIARYEIKASKPSVTYLMLSQDQEAIDASLPALRIIFKQRGLSTQHAVYAALTGWYYLRTERLSPTQRLSPRDLINVVGALVVVNIRTTPDGAEAMVGNKRLPIHTPTIAYCNPGRHLVRLSKPGYQTLIETIEISGDEEMEFYRELKKQ